MKAIGSKWSDSSFYVKEHRGYKIKVLEKHAPLISALKPGRLKVLKDKVNQSFFDIQGGFVEVINNNVTVLVEGAVLVEA